MKTEFQMTTDDYELMKAIIRQETIPVMKFGDVWTGMEKQEQANKFWKDLGARLGFVWDSAERCPGKDYLHFLATPCSPL